MCLSMFDYAWVCLTVCERVYECEKVWVKRVCMSVYDRVWLYERVCERLWMLYLCVRMLERMFVFMLMIICECTFMCLIVNESMWFFVLICSCVRVIEFFLRVCLYVCNCIFLYVCILCLYIQVCFYVVCLWL